MLLLPLRLDIDLHRIPFVTFAVCLICLSVFINQTGNENRVVDATQGFCDESTTRMTSIVMDRVAGGHDVYACSSLFWGIRLSVDPKASMEKHIHSMDVLPGMSETDSQVFASNVINRRYERFITSVPDYQTQKLWYEPHSWDPFTMITAAFAHASWAHVIGNLFFFFAFSAALEVMVGSFALMGLILAYAIGTHVFYSLAMIPVSDAVPTVGLSGVVMAVIALVGFMLPKGRIRCFLLIIVFFRFIALPVWLFAGWYIGWDIYHLLSSENQSGINLVAHVSGACLGYISGVLLFRPRRREVQAIASGDIESYYWLEEMQQIQSFQENKQHSLADKGVLKLIDKYPHREGELRILRHTILQQLPLTPARQQNARLLMSDLINTGQLGAAVDVYIDRLKDDKEARPESAEHYLPLLKLLMARKEYKPALLMMKGFHQRFPHSDDIPWLYFEVAKMYQYVLQKPEQVKRIAGFLKEKFPQHSATQKLMGMV